MCGRYKLTTTVAELAAQFGAELDPRLESQRPRYNVAPTDVMPVLRMVDGHRLLQPLRWGLVPFWARDLRIGSTMINARSETLFEKPAFRDALHKRRCLVVVDGVYEWQTTGGTKTPQLIGFGDGRPFTLAGLWARWKGEPGEIESFTIVTTEANDALRGLHDRMPVLIDERDREEWLDPDNATVDLERLSGARAWPGVTVRAVSRRLGNVKNDDEALLSEDPATGVDDVADDGEASATTKKARKKATATKKAAKKPQGSLF